jgi:hypothetical protein
MKTSVTAWALNVMRLSGIQVALVIFAVSFKRESKTLDLKTVK